MEKVAINIDGLNLKSVTIGADKLAQAKTAKVKTKTAVALAEKMFKNTAGGESVSLGGTPNWERRDEIRRAIMRDLRIIGKTRGVRPRGWTHGNELVFCFVKILPKSVKPASKAA